MGHDVKGAAFPWQGFVAGMCGGLAGAWAMEQLQTRLSQTLDDGLDDAQRASGHAPAWTARSQDQASGDARPATVRSAARAALVAAGRRLTPDEQDVAGPVMHYGFGAGVGALYGALAESRPDVTRFAGMQFGMTVWAGADELGVPALGLARAPWRRPARAHTYSLLSHAVYGLTTEAVRRATRSVLP